MNFLGIVNEVLVRLRDSEVTTVSQNEHSKQICAFVNQAKRRVESAMKWSALLHSSSFSTSAGISSYSLTDWRERSSVDFIFNETSDCELISTTYKTVQKWLLTDTQQARPDYWYMSGRDANGDPTIELYHTPDQAYTIAVHGYRPQDDLTGDTDLVLVPHWPVLLEAYSIAVSERGEDGGQMSDETKQAAREALAEAISIESGNLLQGEGLDWGVDLGPRH